MIAQVGFPETRVAFLLQDLERVDDAGVDTGRRVVGEAQIDRDAISGFETNAVDLAGDTIRLRRQDGFRCRAEVLGDFHTLAGSDSVGLKENVQLALGTFGVPGRLNRSDPFFSDARYMAKFGRLLAQHAKC